MVHQLQGGGGLDQRSAQAMRGNDHHLGVGDLGQAFGLAVAVQGHQLEAGRHLGPDHLVDILGGVPEVQDLAAARRHVLVLVADAHLPWRAQWAPNSASSVGRSAAMTVTRWVTLMKSR